MLDLKANIVAVRRRIAMAAERAGRDPGQITLVAVSKTKPAELINQAIELGITDIGENRIQEARTKLPEIPGPVRRHMIGHLQRNKVKYAVRLFDVIQSIDNIALAEELNARCSKMDRRMEVLIEVNTSGEDAKLGCQPDEALTLLKAVDRLPNLQVRGFMTIAVFSDDPEVVRPCFQQLRRIYDSAAAIHLDNGIIDTLSMGMSSDFELAIEEGATVVRVGTAIFGARNT